MLDIVFVLGSRQPKASEIFEAEKIIAETMINDPKAADTSYAIIQYGKSPTIRAHFDTSRSDKDTLRVLKLLRWFEEGIAIDEGIKTAGKVHEKEGRINAKKVIVVFSNGPVTPSENKLKDEVDVLGKKGVKLISVVLGESVDPKLNVITKVVTPRKELEDPNGSVKEETFKGS